MELQPVELAPPFWTERLSLAGAVTVIGLLAMYASLAGVFGAAATVVARYRSREEFREKTMLMAQISLLKREIVRAEAAIRSIEREQAMQSLTLSLF